MKKPGGGYKAVHEVALAQGLIDLVVESAMENNITKVTKVKIVVGESHGALPEALELAFGVLTRGTLCAGAELVLEKSDLLLKCQACFQEFSHHCPACGGINTTLIQGGELYVDYYEGDEGDEGDHVAGYGF